MTRQFLGDRRPEHSGSAMIRESFRVTNVYAPRLGNGRLDDARTVIHAECVRGAGLGVFRMVLSATDAGHLREGAVISIEVMLADARDDAKPAPMPSVADLMRDGGAS